MQKTILGLCILIYCLIVVNIIISYTVFNQNNSQPCICEELEEKIGNLDNSKLSIDLGTNASMENVTIEFNEYTFSAGQGNYLDTKEDVVE